MKKIIIIGNSGSGKSTLANELSSKYSLVQLDLDSLAWTNAKPPKRKELAESSKDIRLFTDANESWVIEGCYADLIALVVSTATQLIFVNPSFETCINNCKSRPWEPHKYKSKEEQDNNLKMLIEWVKQYTERDDEFSLTAHQNLFDQFDGDKIEYKSNERFEA
ncbi:MAG: shikimate kinase [Kangiella sp.]|nr:MAG: shikimate kinase [Kangiella sp.]